MVLAAAPGGYPVGAAHRVLRKLKGPFTDMDAEIAVRQKMEAHFTPHLVSPLDKISAE